MSFVVYMHETNGLKQVILEDQAAQTQVVVLPETGALLHAITVKTNNGSFNIIDNYPDIESLQNQLRQSYKSCKLSPFACRIPEGRYMYDGKQRQLENRMNDGSAIHGLLFDRPFKMVDDFCGDSQAAAQFKYNYKKEDPGYPFEYRCEIRYTLFKGNVVQVQTTIINLDDAAIPLADGWHPYFKLGGKINDWLLRFNTDTMIEFDQQLVPTGRLLPYTTFKDSRAVEDIELDNCFLLDVENKQAACTLSNPANSLSIDIFPDETYPYLQIYIPGHRQSIAIENLSGAPNCFNNNMGLISLPPRHSKTFTVSYKVHIE